MKPGLKASTQKARNSAVWVGGGIVALARDGKLENQPGVSRKLIVKPIRNKLDKKNVLVFRIRNV